MARPGPSSHRKPWSEKEKTLLVWRWSEFSVQSTAEILGRTPRAVFAQAQLMKLKPRRSEGESLLALSRRSGYDRAVIQRAAKAVGIQLRRQPRCHKSIRDKGRHFLVTPEQAERLISYLEETHTSRGRLPECHPERPHYSKGLCAACYQVLWRRKKLAQSRETVSPGGNRGSSDLGDGGGVCDPAPAPPGGWGVLGQGGGDGTNQTYQVEVSQSQRSD